MRTLALAGLIATLVACGNEQRNSASDNSNPTYSVTVATAVLRRGDYDQARALAENAIASNKLQWPTDRLAEGIRAAAALHTKQYELAASALENIGRIESATAQSLAEADRDIEAHPDKSPAYFARARLLLADGRYPDAMNDCDTAIGLETAAIAVSEKEVGAWKNFVAGHYQQTIDDLGGSPDKVAGRPYALLPLHLAHAKLGQNDTRELARAVDAAGQTVWPAPVLAFYLNRIDRDGLFAAANKAPDDESRRTQLCDANFYAGEDAVLHGYSDDARNLLRKAIDICPSNFFEAESAVTELARIR